MKNKLPVTMHENKQYGEDYANVLHFNSSFIVIGTTQSNLHYKSASKRSHTGAVTSIKQQPAGKIHIRPEAGGSLEWSVSFKLTVIFLSSGSRYPVHTSDTSSGQLLSQWATWFLLLQNAYHLEKPHGRLVSRRRGDSRASTPAWTHTRAA